MLFLVDFFFPSFISYSFHFINYFLHEEQLDREIERERVIERVLLNNKK